MNKATKAVGVGLVAGGLLLAAPAGMAFADGALDSAVAMPRATFDGQFVHHDIFAMAARTRSTSRRTSRSSTAG